jgi:CCR4-NOT transcription complex subunit 2
MSKFVVETLFYIFYNMPFDRWQSLAAQELVHKSWKFWEEKNIWVIEGSNLDEDVKKKISYSPPEWICFDPFKWEYVPIQSVEVGKLISKISNESTSSAPEDELQE